MKGFDLNAFLKDLETVVNIDSGHFYVPGVTAVADFFTERYEALGMTVTRRFHPDDAEHACPFLTVRNSGSDTIDLLIVGHMDTVFPEGTAAARPFTVQADGIARGPGCIDCKGGLMMTLYLVEYLVRNDLLNFNICIAMNSDEERGSHRSEDFLRELAAITRYCLVVEPGRANGEYVKKRKGCLHYKVECTGISAHDGVNPKDGASATLELARWAVALSELADEKTETTVNIGTLHGGTAGNIIPDHATMDVNIRSFDPNAMRAIGEKINEMAAKPFESRCTILLDTTGGRSPMLPSDETERVVRLMEEAGEEIGYSVKAIPTGGGSDGSFFAELGVPTVDGCGPKGAYLHTDREMMDTTTVEARIDVLAGLISRLFPPK